MKVTIPEGYNIHEMAGTYSSFLMSFNKNIFLQKALPQEGYLFPDTYFFLTTDDENIVLSSMIDNFKKKISPLESAIKVSGKKEKDIITMASIIEREAKGDADRGFISGILWKRISLGMALQVDAAPETYKTKEP